DRPRGGADLSRRASSLAAIQPEVRHAADGRRWPRRERSGARPPRWPAPALSLPCLMLPKPDRHYALGRAEAGAPGGGRQTRLANRRGRPVWRAVLRGRATAHPRGVGRRDARRATARRVFEHILQATKTCHISVIAS